jgi:hypothetical protein
MEFDTLVAVLLSRMPDSHTSEARVVLGLGRNTRKHLNFIVSYFSVLWCFDCNDHWQFHGPP